MGVDDFIQRLEIALWAYGFNSDNSIGEDGWAGAAHRPGGCVGSMYSHAPCLVAASCKPRPD